MEVLKENLLIRAMLWPGQQLSLVKTAVSSLCVWCFLCSPRVVSADMPTYYIDNYCSNTLDMGRAQVTAGRLLLRRPGEDIRFENCFIFIKAPANRRLILKFHAFDIQSPYGCAKDNIQLFDDTLLQRPLTAQLCNSGKVPDRAYITSAEDAAVRLTKEQYLADQAELVFTAFHYAPCIGNEFECKNGHCIDGDLYCNGSDNCGDESDYCFLRAGTVLGIIIAVVVVVVVVAIIAALLLYNRQRKIRREREKQILSDLALEVSHTNKSYLADWEHGGARTLSDLTSLDSRSSNEDGHHNHHNHHHAHHHHGGSQTQLHKVHLSNGHHPHHHNLLSKRDSQMRHGAGTAGEGVVHGHGEERGHPYDSEMASRVTYVVQGGTGSSPASRMSTIDRNKRHHAVEPHPSPASPIKRSKSLNLRTPFYFDKEDYYSDGGSSWHAAEENKDRDDKKSKHKEKKKRSTRKAVSRSGSSALYSNEAVKPHEDKLGAKTKRGKVSKKKKSKSGGADDKSDDGYESPPIDYEDFAPVGAGTLDRSAGTNGSSVPLHVSTSYEPRSPTIYLTPPGPEASTAFPHVPHRAMAEDTNASLSGDSVTTAGGHGAKTLVSNTVPVGSRETHHRPDSVYARPHRKQPSESVATGAGTQDFVIETSPSEPVGVGLAARRDSSPLVLHTVQPRNITQQAQTTIDHSGSLNEARSGIGSHPISPVYGKQQQQPRGSRSTTTTENTVIETTPDFNTALPEMTRATPTRHSALTARHPDGSPFLLHTADSRQVEKQLKAHPEDGADVLDHVISFRCYDSPVPREDLQLFRSSMRRSGKSRKSGRSSQT